MADLFYEIPSSTICMALKDCGLDIFIDTLRSELQFF